MSDRAGVVSAATEVQDRLIAFTGLHRPPTAWLHMTVLPVGSTTQISRERMQSMLSSAEVHLDRTVPAHASVGRILYHEEAVMLAVEPRDRLLPLYGAVRAATEENGVPVADRGENWIPHVTTCYSTADQDAGPLIAAAGRSVPPRDVVIDEVSLVVQWGADRSWRWEPVGSVTFS